LKEAETVDSPQMKGERSFHLRTAS
jgi:hypothetical protein